MNLPMIPVDRIPYCINKGEIQTDESGVLLINPAIWRKVLLLTYKKKKEPIFSKMLRLFTGRKRPMAVKAKRRKL